MLRETTVPVDLFVSRKTPHGLLGTVSDRRSRVSDLSTHGGIRKHVRPRCSRAAPKRRAATTKHPARVVSATRVLAVYTRVRTVERPAQARDERSPGKGYADGSGAASSRPKSPYLRGVRARPVRWAGLQERTAMSTALPFRNDAQRCYRRQHRLAADGRGVARRRDLRKGRWR
jgi:hypothetical protein